MNVLMISSSYPKYRGDVTAPFIESIATTIAAGGHTVHMVLPEHPALRRAAVEDGVHFHIYRYAPAKGWAIWGYAESLLGDIRLKNKTYLLAPVVFFSALRTLDSANRQTHFEVVHAHWVLPNGPMAALAAARHKHPLVISLHGSDVFLAEKSQVWGRLAKACFEQARAIAAPSDDLLERAARLGAPDDRLHLVPYGADWRALRSDERASAAVRSQLGLTSSDIMVLAVGRMVYKKGFSVLLDALAQTPESTHLVLAGDGDLRGELEAQAQQLGLTGRVHFAGWVPRPQIPAYLGACDVFAVPSVRDAAGNVDGLPNTALEAMAAGKPLIASRVGGLPQVIQHKQNGWLVDEADPNDLAQAILQLSVDPCLRGEMGAASRAYIRRELNWENVAAKYVHLYESVLEGGPRTQAP